MIEILKILITILGTATVSSGDKTATMISFDGDAESAYFIGKTLLGGVDTQLKDADGKTLSARYILEGKDYEGQACRIFIENNGTAGEKFTRPRITTDSRALGFLNTDSLIGSVMNEPEGLTVRIFSPMTQVPRKVFSAAERQGRVETFYYKAKTGGKSVRKRAQVYLPYGYDAKDKARYSVVFLMHGGGDNTTSFFQDRRSPLPLTNVLDHLIADGRMKPVIVVCPTFYADDENIGKNRMEDAVQATRDFHKELRQSLIPAIDKAYNTIADRDHRAFGGFSMGALCAWYQLAYDVAAVSRFLPLSGDLWVYDEQGRKQSADVAADWLCDKLAASPYADDFRIFAYTGTEDIAGKPETALVNSLLRSGGSIANDSTESARRLFSPRNLQFGVKPGGRHYYGDINEYLYHALPLLWK